MATILSLVKVLHSLLFFDFWSIQWILFPNVGSLSWALTTKLNVKNRVEAGYGMGLCDLMTIYFAITHIIDIKKFGISDAIDALKMR